jgi:hypothetical protein
LLKVALNTINKSINQSKCAKMYILQDFNWSPHKIVNMILFSQMADIKRIYNSNNSIHWIAV